ncbi:hypothetical protein LZP73_03345 [Shewanella sp. AS16]|uniref:hypothetical protein n=1 Tax=Shewanella sp. AS16 TaxID=2907625 RepID=UPI001F445CEC|nr:hypothetical protein [Shewanella sp. AS16]MCE9685250.1 hypothetical protein [Shewanella sp. AS16]
MSAYARRAAAQYQRQKQIQQALQHNQHTLVQMNPDEFLDFAFNVQRLKGKSQTQIVEWVDSILAKENVISDSWQQYKAALKTGSGVIPWGMDVMALGAIALEMKRGGNTFSKYQIKTYQGKPSVIFKGYSGLRKHLTGTRYLANNPKVVSFGIGKLGVAKAIKGGFIATVIISATFHAFEQMLNDQTTWHDFVGGLTVDVGIAAVSSGIAWGAVATYAGGAAAMVAVGPMLAVVVVGAALTVLTSAFVDSDALASRISESLRTLEKNIQSNLKQIKQEINRAGRMYDEDPIGFVHRLFGIPYYGRGY